MYVMGVVVVFFGFSLMFEYFENSPLVCLTSITMNSP